MDQELELKDKHWSEGLLRLGVWLGGLVSYEQAAQILQQAGQIEVTASSLWRRMQVWGKRFGVVEGRVCAEASALPVLWAPPQASVAQRLGVSLDGVMVNIRHEGWKETKMACVFAIQMQPTVDKQTGETLNLARAVDTTYVAHLGGPDQIGAAAWAEAQRRQWTQARATFVIGDGAHWIWNQAALHFGDSQQLIDWYHAKTHLVDAARLLKGADTPAFHRWLKANETHLFQGHADAIANQLLAAAPANPQLADDLTTAAAYFRDNHHRMQYLEMRELEWPLGSGVVESGAKQYKQRLCGPGMRWSRSGAQHILNIRSAILSDRFDQLWTNAFALPQN